MKSILRAAVVAAFAFCCAAAPADAAKKSTSKKSAPKSNLTAIQMECFKQQGAYYDAATKRWMIMADDRFMQSRLGAVHGCVEQKTGKRSGPFLREERKYY
jgi:hypothetical protein